MYDVIQDSRTVERFKVSSSAAARRAAEAFLRNATPQRGSEIILKRLSIIATRASLSAAMSPPYPGSAASPYNNDPGSGKTGFWEIPPNNYDFYSEVEKYKPNVQADGAVLSSAGPAERERPFSLPRQRRLSSASPAEPSAAQMRSQCTTRRRSRRRRTGRRRSRRACRTVRCEVTVRILEPTRAPRGPAGYVPAGDKYAGQEKLKLLVRSEMVRSVAIRNPSKPAAAESTHGGRPAEG